MTCAERTKSVVSFYGVRIVFISDIESFCWNSIAINQCTFFLQIYVVVKFVGSFWDVIV